MTGISQIAAAICGGVGFALFLLGTIGAAITSPRDAYLMARWVFLGFLGGVLVVLAIKLTGGLG